MKTLLKTKGTNLFIGGILLFAISILFNFIDNEFFTFLQGFSLALALVFYGAAIYTSVKQKRRTN